MNLSESSYIYRYWNLKKYTQFLTAFQIKKNIINLNECLELPENIVCIQSNRCDIMDL